MKFHQWNIALALKPIAIQTEYKKSDTTCFCYCYKGHQSDKIVVIIPVKYIPVYSS